MKAPTTLDDANSGPAAETHSRAVRSPQAQPPALLVGDRISKRYGRVQALAEVDLEVRCGEIVALLGENGSGKSTLVKAIAGAVRPDAGSFALHGKRYQPTSPAVGLAHGVALVSQERTLVETRSVAENVWLARPHRLLRRPSRRRMHHTTSEALEQVGLVGLDPWRRVGGLSASEQLLVEVARALAVKPRLLILDEATSRLADVSGLFTLMHRLRGEGVAIIFISHRLREIDEMADRAVVLRDGALVGGLPRSQFEQQRLTKMMVGRALDSLFERTPVRLGEVALRLDGLRVPGAPRPTSLAVREGEIVGVAGLEGSGRTELLETIAGRRRPAGGRILVSGRELKPGSVSRAIGAGLALVPEDRIRQGLALGATLRQNVVAGHTRPLARVRRRVDVARARWAVDSLRIRTEGIDAPVASLSGGNQQKVVLARCLGHRPRVLLLDEPTRGIDVGAKEEIYRLVHEMVAAGMAVLMASSELLEILGLCDRVMVLHEGRLAGELSKEEATEDRIAFLAAGGRR